MKHILVDGKIPAYTKCPWFQQCHIADWGQCAHRGIEHDRPFSCASARAYQILECPTDAQVAESKGEGL